jgi:quinolinate synthase
VVTEEGLLERLRKLYPQKQILSPGMKGICVDMKKISLRSVYLSLKELKYEVKVPEEIAEKAKRAIDKMLEIT